MKENERPALRTTLPSRLLRATFQFAVPEKTFAHSPARFFRPLHQRRVRFSRHRRRERAFAPCTGEAVSPHPSASQPPSPERGRLSFPQGEGFPVIRCHRDEKTHKNSVKCFALRGEMIRVRGRFLCLSADFRSRARVSAAQIMFIVICVTSVHAKIHIKIR